ncbi:LemA family protein [Patescibacteria group bacterium]|nr:LemA family protein [Patescibacteria group bacterium]
MSIITWIILGAAAVILGWIIATFNSFIKFINRTKEAWADIDVQLKRRYDLIPNLMETVKGYATHERELFEKVTQARTAAMGAQGIAEKGKAENMLAGTLKSLFAVAENYPQLKANENFLELQRELSDTENKIQAARRFYNTNVRDLNIKIESFPSNIIAKIFNFVKREFFELEEGAEAREPVKVKF